MGFGSDGIGLLFTIKSKDEASSTIKGIRQAYDTELKRIKDAGKDAFLSLGQSVGLSGEKMAQLRTVAVPAVAAVTAAAGAAIGAGVAIFQLAKSTADLGSKLHDLQQKTGVSAETISSLKVATDQSSSSIEEMSQGVVFLARTMADAERGVGTAQEKLQHLGITSKDLNVALGQAFGTIAKAKPGVDQISLASDAFGKRLGGNLIPTILSFDGDLNKLIETSRRLGATWTQSDLDAADQFGDTLDTLSVQIRGVANEVGKNLIPFIDAKMKEGSKNLADNRQAWKDWGRGIADAVKGAYTVVENFIKYDPLVSSTLQFLQALGKYTTPAAPTTPTGTPERIGTRTVRGSGGNVYETPATAVSTAGGAGEDADSKAARLKSVAAEAARIAQQQVDAADNAFKLNQITRAQDVERTIKANADKVKAEKDALAAQIAVHQQQLEEAGTDAEKRQKIEEQIEKLKETIKDKDAAQERDAINRRTDLRAQELKDQQAHEQARLEIQLQASRNMIEAIRFEIETEKKTKQKGEEEIQVIEKAMLDFRRANLESQLKQAGANDALRMKLTDDLRKLEEDRHALALEQVRRQTALVQEQVEIELQSTRDANKKKADQRDLEILRIQQDADNGYMLESEAADKIRALRLRNFDDERKALDDELKLETTHLERRREIVRQLNELEVSRARTAIESLNQIIQARMKEEQGDRVALDESRDSGGGEGPPGVPSVGPLSGLIDKEMQGQKLPGPDFSLWNEAFENLKKIGTQTFGSLTQGLTGMVQAMLTGSNQGKGAFASLAKAIVASLAVQASVEAIMQLAHAWKEAALATASAAVFDYHGAAMHSAASAAHLAAAAAYGLVGGAAIGAAVLMGGGGGSGSSGSTTGTQAGGSTTQGSEPKVIEVNRRGEAPAPIIIRTEPVHVVVEARPTDGYLLTVVAKGMYDGHSGLNQAVVRVVESDYYLNGTTRELMRSGP